VRRSRFRVWALSLLLVVVSLASGQIVIAANTDVAEKRSDLESVQRRIVELEKAIGEIESSRSENAKKLAASERAVSVVSRQLRQLAEELEMAASELAAQETEQALVEARVAQRQVELASWVRRHYMHGGRDMAPFLSARDPNQIARDARYLEHLGRARLELIEGLRLDLKEQHRLAGVIAARRDELIALEGEQRSRHAELEKSRVARSTALARLDAQLKAQQQEVRSLRDSEQRLGQLVDVLVRQAAEREAARRAREVAEREVARRAREATAEVPSIAAVPAPTVSPRPAVERPRGTASEVARPTPTGVKFAQLRGKMGFPVRGELIGRFGAPRAEGGTRWRGVFIRANGGDEVFAVADGEVVFSDWLRGYGNLIILDHGDDYLTVYGNNDALFRVVGDRIGGGMPIASVGASGGAQGSGLYFEVRHQGQPVDPMLWIRSR